jgi:hypothetical protein
MKMETGVSIFMRESWPRFKQLDHDSRIGSSRSDTIMVLRQIIARFVGRIAHRDRLTWRRLRWSDTIPPAVNRLNATKRDNGET